MCLGRRAKGDEKCAQFLITLCLIRNHSLLRLLKNTDLLFNKVDLLAFFLYKKLCKVLLFLLKLETSDGM